MYKLERCKMPDGSYSTVRRSTYDAVCQRCGKTFKALTKDKKKNRKYCSRACATKQESRIQLTCPTCGVSFSRQPGRMKAKHAFYFCSRECKDHAQRIRSSSHITEMCPSFYAKTEDEMFKKRKHTVEKDSVCHDCGENRLYLLQVHHLDKNRRNNKASNLVIVCSNCHVRRHLKQVNGVWTFCSSSLTPLDMLYKL